MKSWQLEKDVLAKLIVNNDRVPLSDEDKRHVVTWLQQVAKELEKGELFSSLIIQLRIPKK